MESCSSRRVSADLYRQVGQELRKAAPGCQRRYRPEGLLTGVPEADFCAHRVPRDSTSGWPGTQKERRIASAHTAQPICAGAPTEVF
jgi:hypothetical protein